MREIHQGCSYHYVFSPYVEPEPLPERVWIYKLNSHALTHNSRLSFPWRPFLGTMATAPDLEAISALTPFDQGGNMDIPDTKPGNTLYLPVRVAKHYVGRIG